MTSGAPDESRKPARENYGEAVPNSRKDTWALWHDLQARLAAPVPGGLFDPATVRRDAIWGTREHRTKEAPPVQTALWTLLYALTPASAATAFGSRLRHRAADTERWRWNLTERDAAIRLGSRAYAAWLRATAERLDRLPENPTGTDLARWLWGEPAPQRRPVSAMLPVRGHGDISHELARLWGDTPSDSTHPSPMGTDAEGYTCWLRDHPAGVLEGLAGLRKEDLDQTALKAMQVLATLLEPCRGTTNADLERPAQNLRLAADRVAQAAGRAAQAQTVWHAARITPPPTRTHLRAQLKTLRAATRRARSLASDPLAAPSAHDLGRLVAMTTPPSMAHTELRSSAAWRAWTAARENLATAWADWMVVALPAARRAPPPDPESAARPATATPDGLIDTVARRARPLPPPVPPGEATRSGPPTTRGTAHVSEAEVCTAFGLRAIQYGEWMTQADRQAHLDAAFDALGDIARWMGLSDTRAIGLPRTHRDPTAPPRGLALALGARGRGGRAVAHYEPGLHVINMTRTRGAGSLLHEWTHAQDAFLADTDHLGGHASHGGLPSDTTAPSRARAAVAIAAFVRDLSVASHADPASLHLEIAEEWSHAVDRIETIVLSKDTQRQALLRLEAHATAHASTGDARDRAIRIWPAYVDRIAAALDAIRHPDPSVRPATPATAQQAAMDAWVHPLFENTRPRLWAPRPGAAARMVRAWLGPSAVIDDATDDRVVAALAAALSAQGWKKVAAPMINQKPFLRAATTRRTTFAIEAARLDARRATPYWSTPHEMLARAVEAIGFDQMAAMGIRNGYLTACAPGVFADRYRGNPYPEDAERHVFGAAFEALKPVLVEALQSAVLAAAPPPAPHRPGGP